MELFWKVKLTMGSLSKAKLTMGSLRKAKLTMVSLSKTKLTMGLLLKAKLTMGLFSKAKLTIRLLSKAKLTMGLLSKARLTTGLLSKARRIKDCTTISAEVLERPVTTAESKSSPCHTVRVWWLWTRLNKAACTKKEEEKKCHCLQSVAAGRYTEEKEPTALQAWQNPGRANESVGRVKVWTSLAGAATIHKPK